MVTRRVAHRTLAPVVAVKNGLYPIRAALPARRWHRVRRAVFIGDREYLTGAQVGHPCAEQRLGLCPIAVEARLFFRFGGVHQHFAREGGAASVAGEGHGELLGAQ